MCYYIFVKIIINKGIKSRTFTIQRVFQTLKSEVFLNVCILIVIRVFYVHNSTYKSCFTQALLKLREYIISTSVNGTGPIVNWI